jgi:hypothetical protein
MVAFCYLFPFAIVAGIILPLFVYPIALPDPPKPIGIILGCNERPILPLDKDLVPDGIRCFNRSDQYLFHIGGNAEVMSDALRLEREQKVLAAAEAVAEAQGLVKQKLESKGKAKQQDDPRTNDKKPEAKPDANISPSQPQQQVGTPNTGAAAVDPLRQRYMLTGGLVVPLYFVIIAIFGGFVSMLRRVPEYQERLTLAPEDGNHLSWARAREKLVFEALQLITAPLIAITAYYLVDPSSRASSIALAFVAGFSSEIVLMHVRALAEKLSPITTRTAEVELKPSSLTFAKQAVGTTSPGQKIHLTNKTATTLAGSVTISGEFGCTPSGHFNVPAGGSMSFDVTCSPTSVGKKTGQLRIEDNVPGSPRIVPLSGEGM